MYKIGLYRFTAEGQIQKDVASLWSSYLSNKRKRLHFSRGTKFNNSNNNVHVKTRRKTLKKWGNKKHYITVNW